MKPNPGYATIDEYIESFPRQVQRELTKISKGSVQFPLEEPLPIELIGQIVRFRANENRKKAKGGGPNPRGHGPVAARE